MDDSADPKQSTHRRLRVSPSFVIVMTTFIDMIGFGMIIPVLPFHPETVGAGALALGVLIGSFSLMQFIFSPLLGRLSDKVGRRPVILISIFSSVHKFHYIRSSKLVSTASSLTNNSGNGYRSLSSPSLHFRHNHRKRPQQREWAKWVQPMGQDS